MDIITIIALITAFFLAGLIDSIAGGGGLISLPALLVAGLPPQIALGTNKFAASFGTATAMINFMRKKKIIWKVAIIGIFFTVIGSVMGSKAILLIDQGAVAKIILAILPVIAVIMFIPKNSLKLKKANFQRLIYIFICR